MAAAKAFGLYQGIIWRASFPEEKDEIEKMFGTGCEIRLAPDLTPKTILPGYRPSDKPAKSPGHAKFIFVSRIARKKNLLFFLQILQKCEIGKLELEIVGPAEDPAYWNDCLEAIAKLGNNIQVTISGTLSNEEALSRLTESHFFILPTLNENFGYVCIEALAAGCPLMLSDQTIWSDLSAGGLGWDLALTDDQGWIDAIEKAVAMDSEKFEEMSSNARSFAIDWLSDTSIEQATADLLRDAVARSK
jgi:glycosyltransferase involved in cell wall biosynthesis